MKLLKMKEIIPGKLLPIIVILILVYILLLSLFSKYLSIDVQYYRTKHFKLTNEPFKLLSSLCICRCLYQLTFNISVFIMLCFAITFCPINHLSINFTFWPSPLKLLEKLEQNIAGKMFVMSSFRLHLAKKKDLHGQCLFLIGGNIKSNLIWNCKSIWFVIGYK